MTKMSTQDETPPDPNKAGAPHELATCVCFNMRKATRAVTQLYDAALSGSKLRITQFSILAILYAVGAPLRMSDLARELVMDRTTLTRNLRPLEKLGYLTVMAGRDRRERLAAITPEGRALMDAALPKWREVQKQVTDLFGPGRWGHIHADLAGFVTRAVQAANEDDPDIPTRKTR